MQENISFGEWVRQRRHILDLTQQELADQVGCARITLRRIESGALKPSKELAQILLGKLGAPSTNDEAWLRFARGLSGSSASKPVTNLPTSLTTFIGREKEQDEIINLIAKYRLVTLVGVGGIGKTRLSLQVGERLLNDYPDGVWFFPLDSLSNPSLAPQAVASVFNIREDSSDSALIERLTYFLGTKTILLILDNCEHLLDACVQLIKTLLTSCPHLKFLATSREALGIEGEARYVTPSLSFPERANLKSINEITQYESVRLFWERALLTMPSFILNDDKATTVINISRLLDGIPLAIELAAARVDMLQVHEILEQLKHCLDLLISNNRMVQPKHQTIRASLDWSWGLLNEAEQTFLRQLSVFAGGWTLGSAQAVCEGNALSLTSALVKKSLIIVNQESGRETRYHFHEIVRQYAYEKLCETGEEENIRTRHLKYFLLLSGEAEPALRGPAQIEWHKRLNDERDNIRAALEWAAKTNDVEAGLYLSGRLNIFWEFFDVNEGARWLELFIQNPESKTFPWARATALYTQGRFMYWFQRFAEARVAAQECLELNRACGNKHGEVDGLLLSAIVGKSAQKVQLSQQALVLAQSINDTWRKAYALFVLAWGYRDRQHIYSYLEKAFSFFHEVGDLRYMAECVAELGRLAMLNNDIEAAQELLNKATILFRQLNIKSALSNILQSYGRIAALRGDYEQAYGSLQESVAIDEEYGIRMSYLFTHAYLGYLALYQGKITEAREIFVKTARGFFNDKNEVGVVFILEGMASLYVAVGKPAIAACLIGWADATREEISDSRPLIEQADVDKIIAACLAQLGETTFSDVYDEGQKMSLDEAVAFALKTAEEI